MRRSLASLLRTAMMRNETKCQEASKRLGDELKRLDEHPARLKDAGLGDVEVKRVAQGISQRELARRLGVHETQVSRDERNEYFGITLERAAKILDVLNVRLHTKIAIEPLPPLPVA